MKNNSKEKKIKNNLKNVFEQNIERYEEWFLNNNFAYNSELKAVENLLPRGKGIEIGVGTGKFAVPLGVKFGIDSSLSMLKFARKRKIKVIGGIGEDLPIRDSSFDFALLITTLCFLNDIDKSFKEVKRIVKNKGFIILGFIDRKSFLGKVYQKKKEKSSFYRFDNFYSGQEILEKLKKVGFSNPQIIQTLFTFPEKLKKIDDIKKGYGEGGFVIIRMRKNREV